MQCFGEVTKMASDLSAAAAAAAASSDSTMAYWNNAVTNASSSITNHLCGYPIRHPLQQIAVHTLIRSQQTT